MLQRLLSMWRRRNRRPTTHHVGGKLPPAGERRLWGRYPSDLATTFQAISPTREACAAAQVHNISAGGIQLDVNRSVETGTLLHIDLPGLTAGSPSSLLASVVHVSPAANGTWALGCSFIRELSDAELGALV